MATSSPRPMKRPVLDNPSDPGREVDAFAGWYGDLQLAAFIQRFPLTGRHKDDVEAEKKKKLKNKATCKIMETLPITTTSRAAIYKILGPNKINDNGKVWDENKRLVAKFEAECRKGGLRGDAIPFMNSQSESLQLRHGWVTGSFMNSRGCQRPFKRIALPQGWNGKRYAPAAEIQCKLELMLLQKREKKVRDDRTGLVR